MKPRRMAPILAVLGLTFAVPSVPALTPSDEKLLDLVERRAFDFFWNEADPATGLIRDMAGNFGTDTEAKRLHRASIASVGFGLSACCIGVERGWITREQAEERVRNTLRTFETELERDGNGLFYHWIDMRTRKRWMWEEGGGSEFSTIDTALFVHLFPGAWFDFRDKHDAYANYFLSSRNSVLANRQYCVDHGQDGIADPAYRYTTYTSNAWGLSACEAPPPANYLHYGEAEPALADLPEHGMRHMDGTVAIHAAGGSMPYTPGESLAMLKHLCAKYRGDLWGKYGLCDSFNTDPRVREHFNNAARTMWRADIVSGIDQGITLLMIENYRTGLIWKYFMRSECAQKAMAAAGFVAQEPAPGDARLDLSGPWRFRTGDAAEWSGPGFDDGAWGKIRVPGTWEGQGFAGYDGVAWYRKSALVPRALAEAPAGSGSSVVARASRPWPGALGTRAPLPAG